jgi:hypothetical protein
VQSCKIYLARGDKVVRNALSSQNIVAISFPIDFPADKQLGVTHQSAVHALVFRTSECHTGNGTYVVVPVNISHKICLFVIDELGSAACFIID